MGAPEVLMYVTGWCPYCTRARALLEAKGVAFTEIDVEAVPGAHARDGSARRRRHGATDFHRRSADRRVR